MLSDVNYRPLQDFRNGYEFDMLRHVKRKYNTLMTISQKQH